ncbi:hypothetical protein [Blastochloris sulfoviridis]|uniref:Uncharacterized protein n=1 Tax=Blastochloris sulfoviridis TaxID=50712 RepID=A0A5M6HND3_9HYPH|nr:hypothetical protein [Blastochloris sulfoviridis]KAA5597297.1 hypothetical protein F1193_14275 [Blastochloris sulfoviridis]
MQPPVEQRMVAQTVSFFRERSPCGSCPAETSARTLANRRNGLIIGRKIIFPTIAPDALPHPLNHGFVIDSSWIPSDFAQLSNPGRRKIIHAEWALCRALRANS